MQKNFIQNVNDYIYQGTKTLDTELQDKIEYSKYMNLCSYSVMVFLFVNAWLVFFWLSTTLKPCVYAVLDGFNYIKDETLKRIVINYDNLLGFYINFDNLNIWKSNLSNTYLNTGKNLEMEKNKIDLNHFHCHDDSHKKNNTQRHRRINNQKGVTLKSLRISFFFSILFGTTILVYISWFFVTIYYINWINYGSELCNFIKGDMVSIISSLVTMKQYHLNSTFFLADQKQYLNYQTDLFLNKKINLESTFDSLEKMINSTYYDRPCTLIHTINVTHCELVGERSLQFGMKTLKKRMEAFSTNYLINDPIVEASNADIYTFDYAIIYSEEILMEVFKKWKETINN